MIKLILPLMTLSLIFHFCAAQDYQLSLTVAKGWKLNCKEQAEIEVQLYSGTQERRSFKVSETLTGRKVRAVLTVDGIRKSEQILITGKDSTIRCSLPHPGWINWKFTLLDDSGKEFEYSTKAGQKKKVTASIGFLVEPEKLLPGMEKPKDFDSFWAEQRRILDQVPLNAKTTEVEPQPQQKGKFLCYDVQVDCAGGKPVSGYLCVPVNAKEKSLAAVVSFHGAGVRSAHKSTAQLPALYFDINAHGIPNGMPSNYYKDLSDKELYAYWYRGSEDRESYYFRGMFFRVMRALDYIKSRPEWNGKVLIVKGMSMGGAQALAAAGLDPQVTLCMVSVPALMDHGASLAKIPRKPGWPGLFDVRTGKPNPGRMKTAPYYDNLFFADRIKAEVFLSAGLDDFVCCPTSIYTLYNRLGPKKALLEIYPSGNHFDSYSTLGESRYRELLKQ